MKAALCCVATHLLASAARTCLAFRAFPTLAPRASKGKGKLALISVTLLFSFLP